MENVFLSYNFNNDHARANKIRDLWVFKSNQPVSFDEWERLNHFGDNVIKKWIHQNMLGTSVLIVLAGKETANRKWINYEIEHAYSKGKALLGIYTHHLPDDEGAITEKGKNPFDFVKDEWERPLSKKFIVYTPSLIDGYIDIRNNMSRWIEMAKISNTN